MVGAKAKGKTLLSTVSLYECLYFCRIGVVAPRCYKPIALLSRLGGEKKRKRSMRATVGEVIPGG